MESKYLLAGSALAVVLTFGGAATAGAQTPAAQQQSGQQQSNGAAGSTIHVQEPAPQVHMQEQQPNVTVHQPKPDVVVKQSQPQVDVQQPQPKVEVQQPQPKVVVQQSKPTVHVQEAQPQVSVERQGQPKVNVENTGQSKVSVEHGTTGQNDAADKSQHGMPLDSAKAMIGNQVKTSDGKNTGQIKTLLVGPGNRVKDAVVEWGGGIFGLGANQNVVPIQDVTQTGNNEVKVNLTKDQIKKLKSYNASNTSQYGEGVKPYTK